MNTKPTNHNPFILNDLLNQIKFSQLVQGQLECAAMGIYCGIIAGSFAEQSIFGKENPFTHMIECLGGICCVKALQIALVLSARKPLAPTILSIGNAEMAAAMISSFTIATRLLDMQTPCDIAIAQAAAVSFIFGFVFRNFGMGRIARGLKMITSLKAVGFTIISGQIGALAGKTNGALCAVALAASSLIGAASYLERNTAA